MHRTFTIALCTFVFFFCVPLLSFAATLSVSPGTGVYTVGSTFTVRVVINTSGKPINAADGTLSFNPRELQVASVNRSSSIFNLWTLEPTFSNSAGTISFGGGSPTGYTGSSGTIMSITFRTLGAGAPKVSFTSGSVLAADGMGTNVLTNMSGGTYTLTAVAAEPEAEPVYVPEANTPAAPKITSTTHADKEGWYASKNAELTWSVPNDVTAVRTLLDENPSTIPTIVYDEPISGRTIEDLDEGVSYFHIQFKNADGWGAVAHYRLGVDTEKPALFTIAEADGQDPLNPERKLLFTVEDTSPITKYLVQIDGATPAEWKDETGDGLYTLSSLTPGHHTIVVEAFDSAGNSIVSSYAFDIASFDRPVFTEYPERLTTSVIPVFKGTTRPNAKVTVLVATKGSDVHTYETTANGDGAFTFIPDSRFELGIYDVTARSVDAFGAQSELSDPVRFVVEESGFVRVGNFLVSVLSIIVPLVALIVLLIAGTWFLTHRLRAWRGYVLRETKEAETKLASELALITKNLAVKVDALMTSRKGKLTKAESDLIDQISSDIKAAGERIRKEIRDIDDIVE